MDFPGCAADPVDPPDGLLVALNVEPVFVGKNKMDYLVEVANEAAVRALEPDFALLRKVGLRGLIVTAVADSDRYDFVSRFFAPGAGIDEDPATGSAHCCLGPYWAAKLGKNDLKAYQASARGAEIGVEVKGDRVLLRGQAVTVMRGELV